MERRRRAIGQRQHVACCAFAKWARSLWPRRSQLDAPEVAGQVGREAQFERQTIGADRWEGGWQGTTRVDDHDIACREEVAQLAKARVDDPIIRAIRHHQAHIIARQPTRLRRLVRFEARGQGEIERAHRRRSDTSDLPRTLIVRRQYHHVITPQVVPLAVPRRGQGERG
jgi:hypothetical protein